MTYGAGPFAATVKCDPDQVVSQDNGFRLIQIRVLQRTTIPSIDNLFRRERKLRKHKSATRRSRLERLDTWDERQRNPVASPKCYDQRALVVKLTFYDRMQRIFAISPLFALRPPIKPDATLSGCLETYEVGFSPSPLFLTTKTPLDV
ncbi:hypothetical protein EVAR_77134_1 [Eumeta japonica]|uniref:Uncharacterized protein n=1 Tax=Eumeta variegata TaxID=151549 RepID=A0A4C1T1N5_EUMVA|nr:hypothetical protein EVAR_77134_1 [Eumeta japonica]